MKDPKNRQQNRPKYRQQYLRFAAVGIELGVSMLVGLFGGQWLDAKFDTAPWFLIAGLILGAGASLKRLWRLPQEMQRATQPPVNQEHHPPTKPKTEPTQRPDQR